MQPSVKQKYDAYPKEVKAKLLSLRATIYELAESEDLGDISESLKWGEPSYNSKIGSPIRLDWKEKSPDKISIFFNCNTRLVETFRELHSDSLLLVGNREIALPLAAPLPMETLKHCLTLALRYRTIKHLPMLGQ